MSEVSLIDAYPTNHMLKIKMDFQCFNSSTVIYILVNKANVTPFHFISCNDVPASRLRNVHRCEDAFLLDRRCLYDRLRSRQTERRALRECDAEFCETESSNYEALQRHDCTADYTRGTRTKRWQAWVWMLMLRRHQMSGLVSFGNKTNFVDALVIS